MAEYGRKNILFISSAFGLLVSGVYISKGQWPIASLWGSQDAGHWYDWFRKQIQNWDGSGGAHTGLEEKPSFSVTGIEGFLFSGVWFGGLEKFCCRLKSWYIVGINRIAIKKGLQLLAVTPWFFKCRGTESNRPHGDFQSIFYRFHLFSPTIIFPIKLIDIIT